MLSQCTIEASTWEQPLSTCTLSLDEK
uniref:Uncharacterized protein n=1 Tax=Vitis vinifera TaxID=29760 RepID=F6HAT7_VITVI